MAKLRSLITAFVLILLTAITFSSRAQSCSTGVNDRNFFTFCSAGSSLVYNGDYNITIGNGATLTINGNLTVNGTLTITMTGSTSRMIVSSPYTLSATNITFSGSATGKNVVVQGPSGFIDVEQTLNFGGLTIDLDGTGAISAGAITGGNNIACSSDGSCPDIEAGSCAGNANFCNNDVLPVELAYFNASVDNGMVLLTWATATQLNFSHFEIEHSINAEDWSAIVSVKGEGTTNDLIKYAFGHTYPHNGKNYYRLRMVDLDELSEYSFIESVNINANNTFIVSPNPIKDGIVHYEMNFTPMEGDQLIVYDLMGGHVLTSTVLSITKEFTLPNSLAKGTYLVRYNGQSVNQVVRLIVE